MNFTKALEEMKKGKKITRPNWKGYWSWDNLAGTVMMHTKEGDIIDIFDTERKDYTLSNIAAEDFCIYHEPKTLKVFISQPMRNRSDEDILAERERITKELRRIYKDSIIEIIDSFFQGSDHESSPLAFLGESIKLLGTADLVYFAKGWDDARGCLVEACAVELYHIPHIYDLSI